MAACVLPSSQAYRAGVPWNAESHVKLSASNTQGLHFTKPPALAARFAEKPIATSSCATCWSAAIGFGCLPLQRRDSRAGRCRARSSADPTTHEHFPSCVECLLFDIDGTLADTDALHYEIFKELLQVEGFNNGEPITLDFFKEKISGRQNKLLMAEFFPSWDEARAAAWSDRKETIFRERAASVLKPMEGLDRLLDWCKHRGLKCAAVTNAPRPNAEAILKSIGRERFFQELIIGDECPRAKPDPCPYLMAMERLNVKEPGHCIVFEDSVSGARAGVASKAYTIGILTSQSAERLLEIGCHMVTPDYNAPRLWQWLEAAAPKK
mmetsp:Transcript_43698/g.100867  ORF Transcript_43698/g.100867 Transcript_43698/m.100867 type:complete len:324 (+) Transcript_43698:46-1017(+)